MKLHPFFPYFGGKYRAALKYPPPICGSIVEPFAGSAGYAVRYPHLKVTLLEKSAPIAGIWRYLVTAREKEIRALPLLVPGQSIDSLDICQEARWLLGMWVNPGSSSPKKTLGRWESGDGYPRRFKFWGEAVRERIASQLHAIRHWRVSCADFTEAPNIRATWFVDAPYQLMGKHYPFGAEKIDFAELAGWCRSRRGQVLVCEQQGADWLPFRDFGEFKSCRSHSGRNTSAEALWTNTQGGEP